MGSNSRLRVLASLLSIFLLFVSTFSGFAQHGSFYFSAGYNTSWYGNSTIHINQAELGNSYDLYKAKANNKTTTAIGPLLLNYRLGYYFNEWQDLGLEINFDPVRYTIADGSTVPVYGRYNNIYNVNTVATFSQKGGSYYYFDGLNLVLANFVKRWRIYRANSSDISVDLLGKIGFGPALPHFHSMLPVNPTDNPQFSWGGWNYGLESGVRVTLYRYAYVELAAKYDYAMLDGMQVYQGTASQNITTYEVMGSIGFTLPTSHLNPLFRKEKRIITLLPWYQHKDELGGGPEGKKEVESPIDSLGGPGIPEFNDITSKNDPKFNLDSLAGLDSAAMAELAFRDSVMKAAKKNKRKKHKNAVTDSLAAPALDSNGVPVVPAIDSMAPKADSMAAPKVKKRRRKNKNEEPTPVADTSAAPVVVPPVEAPAPPAPPHADTVKSEAPAPPSDTVKTEPAADPENPDGSKKKKKKKKK